LQKSANKQLMFSNQCTLPITLSLSMQIAMPWKAPGIRKLHLVRMQAMW
jgi:hypothetical protein